MPAFVLRDVLMYTAFGFGAQMVGGALGMAHGVCSMTLLLSSGVPPVAASASVNASAILITGFSGLSHMRFRNVDRALVLRLLPAGVLGGVTGACVLTRFPGDALKPFVAAYLAIIGVVIIVRAFLSTGKEVPESSSRLVPMGLAGGFLNAVGGGGWGVFLTSSLIAGGASPRHVVGSVNLSKFFVTAAVSAVLVATTGIPHKAAVLGLLGGGLLAAPLAAWACGRIPRKPMMVTAGILVILVSARTLVIAMG